MTTRDRIRLAMIEDERMLLDALVLVLDADDRIEVVGVAGTLAEGRELVKRERPDVLVVDYRLPDGDSPSLVPELLAAVPALLVITLTGLRTDQTLRAALDAGSRAFLTKDQAVTQLGDAIDRVVAGEVIIDPSMLLQSFGQSQRDSDIARLTPREIDVLGLVADAQSTAEIAATLSISVNTVRNIIAKTFSKLDVHSRLEAVNEAIRRGYLPPRR